MKINLNQCPSLPVFKGITSIRALTDSHQEARAESELLSKIANDAKKQNNILVLNCGDLFCGVYSRDLMADLYLKFKQLNPNVEIVIALGNNDPISSKDKYAPKNPNDNRNSVDFYKDTIKEFQKNGISVVCANIKDKDTGKTPSWIKPYTIVERGGDRIFVTGFCIDRLPHKQLNIDVVSQKEAFTLLKEAIKREKADAIVVLNHDYSDTSRDLYNFARSLGFNIDLIIGGHDHDNPKTEPEVRLYSPKTFSKSMFEIDLAIKDNINKLMNINEVESGKSKVSDEFEQILQPYEKQSGILDSVAPHVLNLPKFYAHPGSLGTLIADGIKNFAGTDIAFFASNIVKVPLYYQEGKNVLNYDTRKIITFDSTVQKAELSSGELKEVLTSALENRLKLGEQNSRFLQCSSNIKIVGEGNSSDKTYFIKQIFIDGQPLLDSNGEPINPDRKISCAFDNYIPTDGRSLALQNASKTDVFTDGKKLRIDEVLKKQLQAAKGKYQKGITYPKYELSESII